MYIQRLNDIQEIIDMKNDYYHKHHIMPLNFSNWTVSDQFRHTIEHKLRISYEPSAVDYMYSYSIPEEVHKQVQTKLGVSQNTLSNTSSIFFPNNTIAIVNICVYLKKQGIQEVAILEPAYFSICKCLETFGINCISYSIIRSNGNYSIDEDLLDNNINVLWITSPIFSTGCYYSIGALKVIEKLLEKGVLIIADESFCTSGNELVRKFAESPNFIAIYSPHKSLSINALKFSVMICNNKLKDFFEQWLDLYCGNLQQSTLSAIYHFLSDNFNMCFKAFNDFISVAREESFRIINSYPAIKTDPDSVGSMFTLYFPSKSFEKTQTLPYIKNVMENTLALYYPGCLNGFSSNMGFCFRVNCALFDIDYIATLNRLLCYIDNH